MVLRLGLPSYRSVVRAERSSTHIHNHHEKHQLHCADCYRRHLPNHRSNPTHLFHQSSPQQSRSSEHRQRCRLLGRISFYEYAHDVHRNLCMKNAWIRSFIFPYTIFVCLYMEIICPNTVKYGTVFRRFSRCEHVFEI